MNYFEERMHSSESQYHEAKELRETVRFTSRGNFSIAANVEHFLPGETCNCHAIILFKYE